MECLLREEWEGAQQDEERSYVSESAYIQRTLLVRGSRVSWLEELGGG